MPALKDFKDPVAVLVSSCDAFFDTWRPFVHFFRKSWPDCPFPVYLIVNEIRVRSSFVQPIAVGTDRNWASNMKGALAQISAPHVLYFQDDYFLNGPIRESQLAEDFEYALTSDVDALCLRARSVLEPEFQALNPRFGVVPPDSDGRTRLQVTLWKRKALLSILHEGENAWEMEANASARTRELRILSYSARSNMPIPYLMSAIVRGLWMPEALAMCEADGVPLRPHFRGTYSDNSFLRSWRRARTRRALRRELASRRAGVMELD